MPRIIGGRATGRDVKAVRGNRQGQDLQLLKSARAKHQKFMRESAKREEAKYQDIAVAPKHPENPVDEDES